MLVGFHCTIEAANQSEPMRLLSSIRAANNSLAFVHERISNLRRRLGESEAETSEHYCQWKKVCAENETLDTAKAIREWLASADAKSVEIRYAFLSLLKSEIEIHKSSYTPDQLLIMQKAYEEVAHQSQEDGISSVPEWFVPSNDLLIDEYKRLEAGGFGSVYLSKWLDSTVVVKKLEVTGDGSSGSLLSSILSFFPGNSTTRVSQSGFPAAERKAFEREVDIWFRLSHPHVVRLFGACHVGTPFFVCEYATKGSLEKYLRDHPDELWLKLHEAALGVQYLHERGVVHGNLKCNNIVIGSDGKAKVTDFGLNSIIGNADTEHLHVSGAFQWVAPECLVSGTSQLSSASDVYSFAMCIVEALRVVERSERHRGPPLPWGGLGYAEVKVHTSRGTLPLRPSQATDDQWATVERMCQRDPAKRVKISTVVDELARHAGVADASGGGEVALSQPPPVVILEMKAFTRRLNGGKDTHGLHRLFSLLWDRLDRVYTRLTARAASHASLDPLLARAVAGTKQLEHYSDTLAQYMETTLQGCALHRRLDKFMAANFMEANEDGAGFHDWKTECSKLLSM